MNLAEIRNSLLSEAISSPNLLTDIAGLEMYVAESYNNRSLIELLQNADDAGATEFCVEFHEDNMYIANNGRLFTDVDINSLCRSAASSKERGQSIGYRGIGFKSVVAFTNEINLVSGEFSLTFSKDKTKELIPEAKEVPLIRIPHDLILDEHRNYNDVVQTLQKKGFGTVFIFPNYKQSAIDTELDLFNATSILFLRNIRKISVYDKAEMKLFISKDFKYFSGRRLITIQSSMDDERFWFVTESKISSIGICIDVNGNTDSLDESDALIYSFLPTEDTTGFKFIINGDFSTDPSRRHLIFDNYTKSIIDDCAEIYCNILESCLKDINDLNKQILSALIPFCEPSLLQFKKNSLSKEITTRIKKIESSKRTVLKICPSWINLRDYETILKDTDSYIARDYLEIHGLKQLMSYLGTPELQLHDITNTDSVSQFGCTEIFKKIFSKSLPSLLVNDKTELNLHLIDSDGEKLSLSELKEFNNRIDNDFLRLLNESGISNKDIILFFTKNLSKEYAETLFDNFEEEKNVDNEIEYDDIYSLLDINKSEIPQKHIMVAQSKPVWRSAEENALYALNSLGFNLKDVSKQNVGYDLEGTTKKGNRIYIEVKSVNSPGEKIVFTNNEIALAQDLGDEYYVAVVRVLKDEIEMTLINDPVNKLDMERQAVQWKWICEDYQYNPITIKI